jgi:hypothetical protein
MNILKNVLMLLSLCLAGCLVNQVRADISRQIHVFGIELYSGVDYREIAGVRATEEPCLKGYERSFDPLEITIGYSFDRKIRKITTRNPGTSLFGISPGISAEEGKRIAQQAGFQEVAACKYQGKDIRLTLLVDGKDNVFGITVETVD